MNISDINFKAKNIIFRAAAFIIYFAVSGFAGKLAAIFASPAVNFFTGENLELKAIILYILSVAVMFALISFFSSREGYGDMELSRFSLLRDIVSCIVAALIFFTLCFILYYAGYAGEITAAENDKSILWYFFMPYFMPDAAVEFLANFEIGEGYSISALIQGHIGQNVFFLALTMLLCILFMSLFYAYGRPLWIKAKNNAAKQAAETEMENAVKAAIGINTAAEEDS